MKSASSTVSTLVVCWNNRDFLSRCLESVPAGSELIVVDNGSTDGSGDLVVERFPSARLVRLDQNVGFAAGVNRAAAEATGTYLLLLNPDAEATPRAIERLSSFLDEHADCGAAAGRLLSMTEEPQKDFHARRLPTMRSLAVELLLVKRLWPRNPITRRAEAADLDETVTGRIERSASCCLMVRRAAFEQVNGFDEQFTPAWFEDADLCKRLIEAGWSIYFVPSAVFRHMGGVSVRTLGRARRKRIFYRNMERYVRKHYGRTGAAAVRTLLVTGMGLRVAASALRADREGMQAFAGVLGGALRGWKHE
jgi:N-acetylglucosaminyl-diphospho-decaprenol L-rhamnosyltransferase